VRAVLALSFERIHRSNLIGMGILPLVLPAGWSAPRLQIGAEDIFQIDADPARVSPGAEVRVSIRRKSGGTLTFNAVAAIETALEVELLQDGGILPHILHRFSKETPSL
jgi:aconitate hydratase